MKGAIFTGFAEFIEQEFQLTTWLKAVEACKTDISSEYLANEIYDDSEFVHLLAAIAELTNVTKEEISRRFGHFFFPTLMSLAQKHTEGAANLFDFLRIVDSIIHMEVQKADPLAYTPSLFYDQPKDNVLMMRYVSKRKMCHFAEGLILGAANYFKQEVILSQSQCMCEGDEHCLIQIKTK